jgi:hypothetical protein
MWYTVLVLLFYVVHSMKCLIYMVHSFSSFVLCCTQYAVFDLCVTQFWSFCFMLHTVCSGGGLSTLQDDDRGVGSAPPTV